MSGYLEAMSIILAKIEKLEKVEQEQIGNVICAQIFVLNQIKQELEILFEVEMVSIMKEYEKDLDTNID